MLSIFIDIMTLGIRRIFPRKVEHRDLTGVSVTAVCPLFNEEGTMEAGVEGLINQSYPLKNIFLLDDCSTDATEEIGKNLQKRYPGRVIYLRASQNSGKAKNINDLVENHYFELGDLIFINDGDCVPLADCIEMMMQKFADNKVVAVTGFPIVLQTPSWINNIFSKGKMWQINSLSFRKTAQCERDAMSVISGAICMYDKVVLKKHPMPIRTATEDLDHTWQLIEAGYRLEFERLACTAAPDVYNLKSQWAQSYRWSKGFWQTFLFHNSLERTLDQSFMLKYTVVYVTFLDSLFMLIRYIVTVAFAVTGNMALLWYLVAEMFLYAIPGAVFYGTRGILYLPCNYIYQMLTFTTWALSGYEMITDYMKGNIVKWSNRWSREYGKRSVIIDPTMSG